MACADGVPMLARRAGPRMASPHDAIFRYTFGPPEHGGPLLRCLLPPALTAAIDWQSLRTASGSYVDRRLRRQHSDLLFHAALDGRPAILYLLVEHKSRNDPSTALQMAGYVLEVLRAARRRQRGAARAMLPVVVPIVLHHGPTAFTAATDLRQLLDVDELTDETTAVLEPLLPRFPFLLCSLHAVDERTLRAWSLTVLGKLTLACMQFVARRTKVDADAAVGRWADIVLAVLAAPSGHDALAALSSYLIQTAPIDPEAVQDALERHVDREAAIIMKTAAARLRAEGRAEGKAEGRAELLFQLLRHRFGHAADVCLPRLRVASAADLERWAARLLTATTIDAVFEG